VYSSHGKNGYNGHNYVYVLHGYDGPFDFRDGEVEDMKSFTINQAEVIFA
jgi:hypothetical protein